MLKHDEDDLILKGVSWAAQSAVEIHLAGGHAPGVLKQFSKESLATMVRNDLFITYKKQE